MRNVFTEGKNNKNWVNETLDFICVFIISVLISIIVYEKVGEASLVLRQI